MLFIHVIKFIKSYSIIQNYYLFQRIHHLNNLLLYLFQLVTTSPSSPYSNIKTPMQPSNSKIDSQSRLQPKKFQYFTGDTNNNNLTASSIDQHRNSIEQRIANLESKLAKKFNPQLELSTLAQPQSENYVNTRRMYQYSGVNAQNKNFTPSNPQISNQSGHNPPQNSSSGFSNSRQMLSNKGSTFNYLANFDKSMDEMALREKSKFSWQGNNDPNKAIDKIQPRDKLKAVLNKSSVDRATSYSTHQNFTKISNTQERPIGKKIKNKIGDSKGQENTMPLNPHRKYQSSQKFTQKHPINHYLPETPLLSNAQQTTTTIPRSNPILNGRYFQEFNQLNTNISNLKTTVGGQYPFENYQKTNPLQSRTISYDTGVNLRDQAKNNQLYEMMKSIMVGQERLEKELMMLKNSKMQEDRTNGTESNIKNAEGIKPYKQADRDKLFYSNGPNKKNNVPDSRLMSPLPAKQQQPNQHNKSRSPLTNNNRKSVSPQTHKSRSPVQNKSSNPTSTLNRKRANSAVMGKKLPGKIQKNKQRFDELYKQAQMNKRLNETNSRITVSSEVVSSVWQKIKQSIKRAESQDVENSVIYHENNRSINDHLVSKIELQKKLKNDLVKKVYDMVENKCLFK